MVRCGSVMRRKEKEITYAPDIEEIVNRSPFCRLAMSNNGDPYVVPLCFGYKSDTFYLHSAREGRKLDILRKNERVCVEIDTGCEIVRGDDACDWSIKYRSVIGFGRAAFIDDEEAKREALDVIMAHYAGGPYKYDMAKMKKTVIIKVVIERITGKQSGY